MAIGLDEKVIAANYSAAIVRLAGNYGISENAVLEGVGITPEELQSTGQAISMNQNIRLTSNAVALTNIPHLGLILGQNLNVTAHGMMGIAVMSSKNVGDALNVACQYFKTRFAALSASSEVKDDMCIVTIQLDSVISDRMNEDPSMREAVRFGIDTLTSSACSIVRLLTQQSCNEFSYQFSYSTPSYYDEYKKIFGDSISFDQGVNRISFPAYIADLALPFYDEVTLQLALKSCSKSLSKQQVPLLLKHKIRALLDEIEGDFPDVEALSRKFNMCSRTVRRKLQAEGTSYQKILNDKRQELAKKYLLDSSLSIIQIASELKFVAPSSFSRIFKQWTGILPTEYRKRHLKR